MFAPDRRHQSLSRVPLATIDRVVSARLGPTRVKGNAQPAAFNRQVAMYLAKHVGDWSLPRIGKFYNGRHHTTVLWAVKHIGAMRTSNSEVDGLVSALTEEIRSLPNGLPGDDRLGLRRFTEPLLPCGLNDEFLDALADRIVERLKLRGVHCQG
jgi:Bacterial dnaA protein helix-turn-helix